MVPGEEVSDHSSDDDSGHRNIHWVFFLAGRVLQITSYLCPLGVTGCGLVPIISSPCHIAASISNGDISSAPGVKVDSSRVWRRCSPVPVLAALNTELLLSWVPSDPAYAWEALPFTHDDGVGDGEELEAELLPAGFSSVCHLSLTGKLKLFRGRDFNSWGLLWPELQILMQSPPCWELRMCHVCRQGLGRGR